MKNVLSVSLGSSKRDKDVDIEILNEEFHLARRGTDGDVQRAKILLEEYDGAVDALTLGGIDRYLWLGNRKYEIRDARRLIKGITRSPVVDGSGIKNSLERRIANFMEENDIVVRDKRVLMVSAVDRYAMAESFKKAGAKLTIGDLIFADELGVPLNWWTFHPVAWLLLPSYVKKPFQKLYPTGEKQTEIRPEPRFTRYYDRADIVAGDFHLIRRRMPDNLDGKIIVTNTTTEQDVEELQKRNVQRLVTTTPRFQGRSFGTNMVDGIVVALYGKRPEELTKEDYLSKLDEIGFKPGIEYLN